MWVLRAVDARSSGMDEPEATMPTATVSPTAARCRWRCLLTRPLTLSLVLPLTLSLLLPLPLPVPLSLAPVAAAVVSSPEPLPPRGVRPCRYPARPLLQQRPPRGGHSTNRRETGKVRHAEVDEREPGCEERCSGPGCVGRGTPLRCDARCGSTGATDTGAGRGADPVERTSWRGDVTAASLIEVSNPFGDLRLRFGGPGRTVEVAAALQQLDPAGSRLELVVEEKADPATVRVVRTAAASGPPPTGPRVDRSRADMVVLVPAGITVKARTDRGLLESVGLESDVDLESASGEIRVRSTSGRVTAHNERGEISAMLVSGATEAPQRLSTVTGPIEVWVSDGSALDVTMATSGRLISDFSTQVEHHDQEEPDKVATAKVGAGGHLLELRSQRGDVCLRRQVQAEQVAPRPE